MVAADLRLILVSTFVLRELVALSRLSPVDSFRDKVVLPIYLLLDLVERLTESVSFSSDFRSTELEAKALGVFLTLAVIVWETGVPSELFLFEDSTMASEAIEGRELKEALEDGGARITLEARFNVGTFDVLNPFEVGAKKELCAADALLANNVREVKGGNP